MGLSLHPTSKAKNMKELNTAEVALAGGGAVEVVYGESSWLSDLAAGIRDFFGSGSTSTPALNANIGIRG
jgi:hypothetical protein